MGETWKAMCVTHGMPCVNMHGSFEAYIRGFTWAVHISKGAESFNSWDQQGEGGGREKRKGGKDKRKGGNERRKGGKEKKRKEEKRRRKGRKRGKRKRKRKECCTVRRLGRKRTGNCSIRGRFPPTLVTLRLGTM